MEIQEVFTTIIELVAQFKDEAAEITGAKAFLEEYEERLQSGLSGMDDLDTYEQWALFDDTWELLDIIAEETEKLTSLPGSALKVAIIRGLQRELGLAIKGLDD